MAIQIKRGIKADITPLKPGEFGLCLDTNELFIGSGDSENITLVFGTELTNTTIPITSTWFEGWNIDENNSGLAFGSHFSVPPQTIFTLRISDEVYSQLFAYWYFSGSDNFWTDSKSKSFTYNNISRTNTLECDFTVYSTIPYTSEMTEQRELLGNSVTLYNNRYPAKTTKTGGWSHSYDTNYSFEIWHVPISPTATLYHVNMPAYTFTGTGTSTMHYDYNIDGDLGLYPIKPETISGNGVCLRAGSNAPSTFEWIIAPADFGCWRLSFHFKITPTIGEQITLMFNNATFCA